MYLAPLKKIQGRFTEREVKRQWLRKKMTQYQPSEKIKIRKQNDGNTKVNPTLQARRS